jgi:DNA-binding NarL/FixJ family response regulator
LLRQWNKVGVRRAQFFRYAAENWIMGGDWMALRIALADDMDLVTHGARLALAARSDWLIAGEYQSLVELGRGIKAQPVDVIVCGQTLDPALDPLQIVGTLQQMAYRTRLILMGASTNGLLIGTLLNLGVHGYLYRADALHDCLPLAVEMVTRSRTYLSPTANAEYAAATRRERAVRLTRQEQAVLHQLAQGRKIAEIARTLQLPPRRIYTIRDTLRNRFDAATNEQLMLRALAEGFNCVPE